MKASCQSLTSQFVKVIGGFVNDYQELRETAASIMVDTIIPGSPGAEEDLNRLIDQAIDLETKLLTSYGVVVGQGKGKIGPRYLIIPTKKVTGDLLTERTFAVAPSPFDKVTITVKKTGGKAGADIAACAKYADGEHYDEKSKSIPKGKDSKGDTVKFVFTNMAEKVLTIHLVQTGFPTDTCNYCISMEGEFDHKEMENLASQRKGTTAAGA